jgi:hypothetical protein
MIRAFHRDEGMTETKPKVFLLLSSILFSLILAELLLRVFVVQETKRLASYDPEIGWTGVPNGDGVYVRLKDSIMIPFRYNGLGFRDEEVPPRDASEFQVLVLGDSFVESLEVSFEKTFHELIESDLKVRTESGCVVNISSQGYSTAQEILAYRKFRPLLDPDAVLLVFYTGNDFEDNGRGSFAHINSTGKLIFDTPNESAIVQHYQSFQRWLYERSHLVFFVKNAAENLSGERIADTPKAERSTTPEYSRRITELLILEANAQVAAEGIAFGVVIFPSKKEIRSGSFLQTDFVATVCESGRIPYLRLDQSLTLSDFFVYDEHLNESGHRKSANEILSFLDRYVAPAENGWEGPNGSD